MKLQVRVVVNGGEELVIPCGDGRQDVLWLALSTAHKWALMKTPNGRVRQRELGMQQQKGQFVPVNVRVQGVSVNPKSSVLDVFRSIRTGNLSAHSLDCALHGELGFPASGTPESKQHDESKGERLLGNGDAFHQGGQAPKKRIKELASEIVFDIELATSMGSSASGVPTRQYSHWRDLAFGHSKASHSRLQVVREEKLMEKAERVAQLERERKELLRQEFMRELGQTPQTVDGCTVLAFFCKEEDVGSTAMNDWKELRGKVERFAHNDTCEIASIRKTLLLHYRLLRNAFKYYSGMGTTNADTMSFPEFINLMMDIDVIEPKDMLIVARVVKDIFHVPESGMPESKLDSGTFHQGGKGEEEEEEEEEEGEEYEEYDEFDNFRYAYEGQGDAYLEECRELDGGYDDDEEDDLRASSWLAQALEEDSDSESDDEDHAEGQGVSLSFANTPERRKLIRVLQKHLPMLVTYGYIRRLDFFECIMKVFVSAKLHKAHIRRIGRFMNDSTKQEMLQKLQHPSERLEKYMVSHVVPTLEAKTHTRSVRKALENQEVLAVFAENVSDLKRTFSEFCGLLSKTVAFNAKRKAPGRDSGGAGVRAGYDSKQQQQQQQQQQEENEEQDGVVQKEFTLMLQGANLVRLSEAEKESEGKSKHVRRRRASNLMTWSNKSDAQKDGESKNDTEKETWFGSDMFLQGRVEKAKLGLLTLADTRALFSISQFEDEDQVNASEKDDEVVSGFEELDFKEFIGAVVRLTYMVFSVHYDSNKVVTLPEKIQFIIERFLEIDPRQAALAAFQVSS